MRLVDLKQKRILVAIGVMVFLVLAIAYTQAPSTEPVAWKEQQYAWQTNDLRYNKVSAANMDLLKDPVFWGVKNSAEIASNGGKVAWSLKAVIEEGDEKFVIIELLDSSISQRRDKFKRLRKGDTLPDGALIVAIEKNKVDVESDGVSTTRRLYEK